jgi:manganese/zinc/iron transport system substrate-binding protein
VNPTRPLAGLAISALLAGALLAPVQAQARIRVVATVNFIADTVARIGGDRVEVTGLMGPGVDPHTYRASAGDIGRLRNADIIYFNGLTLEGKMGDLLVQMARTRPTYAVTEDIPHELLREPKEFEGLYDPHVWFDVGLWQYAVRLIERTLAQFDPAGAAAYAASARALAAELDELDGWIREQVATVPEGQRVLITAHDAFGYFGEAYGMEVRGLQGISTASEAGARDVQDLAEFIVNRRIKAVFVETSVSPRAIQAVQAAARARGFEVRIGGELFSDAAGPAGTPEGTYVGMIRHNVTTIVAGLR